VRVCGCNVVFARGDKCGVILWSKIYNNCETLYIVLDSFVLSIYELRIWRLPSITRRWRKPWITMMLRVQKEGL
jgi:hypothetical protein